MMHPTVCNESVAELEIELCKLPKFLIIAILIVSVSTPEYFHSSHLIFITIFGEVHLRTQQTRVPDQLCHLLAV